MTKSFLIYNTVTYFGMVDSRFGILRQTTLYTIDRSSSLHYFSCQTVWSGEKSDISKMLLLCIYVTCISAQW